MVNKERCVDSIRESLRRMGEFFNEDVLSVDQATLAGIESDLVRMEYELMLFSQHGRPDAVSRRP